MALLIAACGDREPTATTPTATPTTATPTTATPTTAGCVGAAARASTSCPGDGLTVVPAVGERERDRGTPCARTEPLGLVTPCAFGAPAEEAKTTFALIGDSHAGQLRSAFDVVAREQGWRGYAITRNSCAYVRDGRPLPEPEFSQCLEFKRRVPEWLTRHPEVSTVFVVGLTRDAAGPFAAATAGYVAAWEALPASVKHIVVLRDTPELRENTLECVSAALAQQRAPGPACATPKAQALPPDPAVAAASEVGPPRVQTIDLTRYFCDARDCFPVVGGVLAYKDFTHVTPSFAATLGPFLLTEVRRLITSW